MSITFSSEIRLRSHELKAVLLTSSIKSSGTDEPAHLRQMSLLILRKVQASPAASPVQV